MPSGTGDAPIDTSWSPDGKTIAYWTPGNKTLLELVDAAGHAPPRTLFHVNGTPSRPLWSRDSRSRLVSSEQSRVWLVPVAPGSRPKQLAAHSNEADWHG